MTHIYMPTLRCGECGGCLKVKLGHKSNGFESRESFYTNLAALMERRGNMKPQDQYQALAEKEHAMAQILQEGADSIDCQGEPPCGRVFTY